MLGTSRRTLVSLSNLRQIEFLLCMLAAVAWAVPAFAFPMLTINFNGTVPTTVFLKSPVAYGGLTERVGVSSTEQDFVTFGDGATITPSPLNLPVGANSTPADEVFLAFTSGVGQNLFSGNNPSYIPFDQFPLGNIHIGYLEAYGGSCPPTGGCAFYPEGVLDSIQPMTPDQAGYGTAGNPVMPGTSFWSFTGHLTGFSVNANVPEFDFGRGIGVGTTFSGTFVYDATWANQVPGPNTSYPGGVGPGAGGNKLNGGTTFWYFCGVGVCAGFLPFFDPPNATGYDYVMNNGHLFTSVLLPAKPGVTSYQIYLWNPISGAYDTFAGDATPGTNFTFAGGGVAQFAVRGIPDSAGVDATDPTGFTAALGFNGSGLVNFTITSIPEPSTLLLIAAGIVGVAVRRRFAIAA
jgi:hypothetical protein